ncbi:MAG: hypothetical protein WC107_06185 [Patescibacteria group bacterium]
MAYDRDGRVLCVGDEVIHRSVVVEVFPDHVLLEPLPVPEPPRRFIRDSRQLEKVAEEDGQEQLAGPRPGTEEAA